MMEDGWQGFRCVRKKLAVFANDSRESDHDVLADVWSGRKLAVCQLFMALRGSKTIGMGSAIRATAGGAGLVYHRRGDWNCLRR